MSRGADRTTGRAVLAVTMLAAVLAVAGCAEDDGAQGRIGDPVRGSSINASHGDLRLLATRLEAPVDTEHTSGDNVGLFTTIANDGEQPDRLVGVSSVYARQIVLRNGASGGDRPIDVMVPPGGVASMQYPGGPHLEMVDLAFAVGGGRLLPVTFRFDKGGSVTVNVFVEGFSLPTVSPVTATPSG